MAAVTGKWRTMTGLRYTNSSDVVSVDVEAYANPNPAAEGGVARVDFTVTDANSAQVIVSVYAPTMRFPDFGPYSMSPLNNPGPGRMAPVWAYGIFVPVGVYPGGTTRVTARVYATNGSFYDLPGRTTIFNDSDAVDRRPNTNEVYVNPEIGNDANDGSLGSPCASIVGAARRGRNSQAEITSEDSDVHGLVIYLSDHTHFLGGNSTSPVLHTSDDGWLQIVSTSGNAKVVSDWEVDGNGRGWDQPIFNSNTHFNFDTFAGSNMNVRFSNIKFEDGTGTVWPSGQVNRVRLWTDGGESYSSAPRTKNWTFRFLEKDGPGSNPVPGIPDLGSIGARDLWVTGHYRHHALNGFFGYSWVMDVKLQYLIGIAFQATDQPFYDFCNIDLSDMRFRGPDNDISNGFVYIFDGAKLSVIAGNPLPAGWAMVQQTATPFLKLNSAATTSFVLGVNDVIGSPRVGLCLSGFSANNNGAFTTLAVGIDGNGLEYAVYLNDFATTEAGTSASRLYVGRFNAPHLPPTDIHPDVIQFWTSTNHGMVSNFASVRVDDAQGYYLSGGPHSNLWMINCTDGIPKEAANPIVQPLTDCGFIHCSYTGHLQLISQTASNTCWVDCVFDRTSYFASTPGLFVSHCHWVDPYDFSSEDPIGISPSQDGWFEDYPRDDPWLYTPTAANQGTGSGLVPSPPDFYFPSAGGNPSRGAWRNVAERDYQNLSASGTTPATGNGDSLPFSLGIIGATAEIDVQVTNAPLGASVSLLPAAASVDVVGSAASLGVSLATGSPSASVDVQAIFEMTGDLQMQISAPPATANIPESTTSDQLDLSVALYGAEATVSVGLTSTPQQQLSVAAFTAAASTFTPPVLDQLDVSVALQDASAVVDVLAVATPLSITLADIPQPQDVYAYVDPLALSLAQFSGSASATVLAGADPLNISLTQNAPTIGIGVNVGSQAISLVALDAVGIGTVTATHDTQTLRILPFDQYGVSPSTVLVDTLYLEVFQISTSVKIPVVVSNLRLPLTVAPLTGSASADTTITSGRLNLLLTLFPSDAGTAATAVNLPQFMSLSALSASARAGVVATAFTQNLLITQRVASSSTDASVVAGTVFLTMGQPSAKAGIPGSGAGDVLSMSLGISPATAAGGTSATYDVVPELSLVAGDPYAVAVGKVPTVATIPSGSRRERLNLELEADPLPREKWRIVLRQN